MATRLHPYFQPIGSAINIAKRFQYLLINLFSNVTVHVSHGFIVVCIVNSKQIVNKSEPTERRWKAKAEKEIKDVAWKLL